MSLIYLFFTLLSEIILSHSITQDAAFRRLTCITIVNVSLIESSLFLTQQDRAYVSYCLGLQAFALVDLFYSMALFICSTFMRLFFLTSGLLNDFYLLKANIASCF